MSYGMGERENAFLVGVGVGTTGMLMLASVWVAVAAEEGFWFWLALITAVMVGVFGLWSRYRMREVFREQDRVSS